LQIRKRKNKRKKTKCYRDPHVAQRDLKRNGFSHRVETPTPATTTT
jgi:hypothetical protein